MKHSVYVRLVTSVLAPAFAVVGLSALATPADADDADDAEVIAVAAEAQPLMSTDVYEKRVRYWINQKRAARGLEPLRQESCTDGVAERWGNYLARTSEFFHQSMGDVLDACGATYAGETLAKGPVGPRQLVRLWMHSPGHRAILLSKSPRRIGIGAYPDASGAWVVAADFTRF